MKTDYAPFDPCWIELHGKDGVHEGRVLLSFHLDTDFYPFHVIKLVDPQHKTLEVRDATLMSPTKDTPPVLLRNAVSMWEAYPEKFYKGLQ